MKFIKKIFNFVNRYQLFFIISFGIFSGLFIYLFKASRVTSYISDDPKACINCHIMKPQYITWQHSSHREVAVCNDCHVPHDNVLKKYAYKAVDGLYHATVFSLNLEQQTVFSSSSTLKVLKDNCIRCHINTISNSKYKNLDENHLKNKTSRNCWECHRDVPHGTVNSLGSVGFYIDNEIDEIKLNVPEWIKKSLNKK